MISRIKKLARLLQSGDGNIFIGDVPRKALPLSIKPNEWGGANYMYEVVGDFYISTMQPADNGYKVIDDRVTSLSIHTRIPEHIVEVDGHYSIRCSPRNSILIRDMGKYRRACLIDECVIGKQTPIMTKSGLSNGRITNVTATGKRITMYDISLENGKVFLADNYLFVYDTVGVHVPISNEAVNEAKRMMPSKTLYDDVGAKIVSFPDHSAALGIYILSKTPEGRKAINKYLPKHRHISDRIDKPALKALLGEMAKEDSRAASIVVDNLVRLGDGHSYDIGFSLGLSDLAPLTDIRERVMGEIKKDILHGKKKSPDELREIYKRHVDRASFDIGEYFKTGDSPIGDVINSKARGSSSQMRDILLSPIAVNAAEAISKPISHSYTEGLKPGEYFAAAAGARAGTISKNQGTAEPGALGNLLFANTNMLVINKDRGNSMGVIRLPLDDPNELVDRYVGEDVKAGGKVIIKKDSLVEPRTIQIARKHGLKDLPVYTALGSSSADGGIPAMSYGLMPGNVLPEVGYNIGVHSSAGIVAPLYTESMGSFHCFHADVSVYTSEGHLRTIESLYNENYKGRILDKDGQYVDVIEMWAHEVTDKMAISKTKGGESLIAQYNHPMQIANNADEEYDTRPISKSDKGMSKYMVQRYPAMFGSVDWDWDICPYLLGAHIAEGSYTKRNNPNHNEGLVWSQCPGTPIYDRYCELLGKRNNGKSFVITNNQLNKRMQLETGRVSHQRRLPYNILNYSRSDAIGVLAGIIDGDGTIVRFNGEGRGGGLDNIVVDTTSYALSAQLHILCEALGYASHMFPCKFREISLWQPFRTSIKLTLEQKEELSTYSIKASSLSKLGKRKCPKDNGAINYIEDAIYKHPMVYDIKTTSGTFMGNEIWTHNTGGSLQDKNSGYPRLKQVLELTRSISNKATLATTSGTVSGIEKDSLGGSKVLINEVEHYIQPSNKLAVSVGSVVEKGDPLSDGPIDPRDLAKLKSMGAAQSYMVDELIKNTPGNLRRRAAEVIVEGITRYGEVTDPGESEYMPGDVKLISDLEKRNKDQDQGIKYDPVFRGINSLPSYTQSWPSKLNFRNIKKNLSNDVTTGAVADTHSYEPSFPLATGISFGKGENGKY
jgi:hypothetical protein